jgi:uncharacterized RmlC-like cupin family protein
MPFFGGSQKNLKWGYNSVGVCMHAYHSVICMHPGAYAHTHMHTQNLLVIHVGYNVKYEGGKKQV